MAQGTDAIILAALIDHLLGLTFSPALKISMPNVDFPGAGQTKPDNFLEVIFLPNQTRTRTVGAGRQQHRGIFQVSVCWKHGTGLVKPLDAAGKVIDRFAKDTVLYSGAVKVKVPAKPWAASPITDDDRVKVAVSIPYESAN